MPRKLMLAKMGFVTGTIFLVVSGGTLRAQLGSSNERGVSIGQAHLIVRNPAQHKKLFVDILAAKVTHRDLWSYSNCRAYLLFLNKGSQRAALAEAA